MSNWNIAKKGKPYLSENGVPACEVITFDSSLGAVIAVFYGKSLKQAAEMAKGCASLINQYPLSFGINPKDYNV